MNELASFNYVIVVLNKRRAQLALGRYRYRVSKDLLVNFVSEVPNRQYGALQKGDSLIIHASLECV